MADGALDFAAQRERMVAEQLVQRGINDPGVLRAFRQTPRHEFVARAYHHLAYNDTPLPIPAGQTISQPYIVAFMLQALRLQPGDRVLEIGAGSGYCAALLSNCVSLVWTVERQPELVALARDNLARCGCRNVVVCQGDGSLGWPDQAPYQAIVVAASGPAIPDALGAQLAVGGRLVMPIGDRHKDQRLILLYRHDLNDFTGSEIAAVRFVPLIGQEGW